MQEVFTAAQKVNAEELGFDVNDNITIYKNLPVTSIDHFWLKVPKNISVLYSCAALLKSKTNEVIAVGFLEDDKIDNGEIRPHLNFGIDNEHINYNQFEKQTQYKILLLPADQENFFDENLNLVKASTYEGKIYLLECNLKFEEELPTTKKSLCIDFGTSNITAGTYVNGEISLVNFTSVKIRLVIKVIATIIIMIGLTIPALTAASPIINAPNMLDALPKLLGNLISVSLNTSQIISMIMISIIDGKGTFNL